jgi:hypothetical protein
MMLTALAGDDSSIAESAIFYKGGYKLLENQNIAAWY